MFLERTRKLLNYFSTMLKPNISKLIKEIPPNVQILAATKSRSIEEIKSVISLGINILGENYLQEAKEKYAKLKGLVSFHLIGHLQTNKVKEAVEIFDMIQTVDSLKIAKEINKRTEKLMPVLIEVNIGYEKNKTGILPSDISEFLSSISTLKNLDVKGLMTMAPVMKLPEDYRRYFKKMKQIFEDSKAKNLQNIRMDILSMGMSESYMVAIEEGSSMVRLGRILFEF